MNPDTLVIKKRSLWGDVWKRLKKNPTAVFGMILFLVIVLACIGARFFYNYDADVIRVNVREQLQGPSAAHLLGTDELGRDILARILWGGGTSLLIASLALVFAFCCGTILGTVAAYYGKFSDTIIMRAVDIVMAIPPILLMITLANIMPPSTVSLVFVVGFGLIPNQARLIRGQVLQVSSNEYVESARILGASDFEIITKHILPNALGPVITSVILDIAYAITVISTMSFLGLGVQAPAPEWGAMLAGGRDYIRNAWHITTFPGLALMVTIIALTLVGDGMRDALDPKMKR